jgi:hypothetical protein
VRGESSENLGLHHNPAFQWMYLSNMMPDEMFVFRQADSEGRVGVPHCAIELPVREFVGKDGRVEKEVVRPRESIEVRMVAYFRE